MRCLQTRVLFLEVKAQEWGSGQRLGVHEEMPAALHGTPWRAPRTPPSWPLLWASFWVAHCPSGLSGQLLVPPEVWVQVPCPSTAGRQGPSQSLRSPSGSALLPSRPPVGSCHVTVTPRADPNLSAEGSTFCFSYSPHVRLVPRVLGVVTGGGAHSVVLLSGVTRILLAQLSIPG